MLQTDFGAVLCRDGREKHERVIGRTEKRQELALGVLSSGEFESAVRIHPSSRSDAAHDGQRLLDGGDGNFAVRNLEAASTTGGAMRHRSIRKPAALPHFHSVLQH